MMSRRYVLSVLMGLVFIGLVAPVCAEEATKPRTVLAVLPVMMDDGSTITHPKADEVIQLLQWHNRDKEDYLVLKLKEENLFFDVRKAGGDPAVILPALVQGREVVGTDKNRYRQYAFSPGALYKVSQNTVADQLLVIIMSGQVQKERRRDRNLVDYLETDYNSIVIDAVLLTPEGRELWRYGTPAGEAWLPLQYPNFDDAHYNLSDTVPLMPLQIEGLERQLVKKEKTVFNRPDRTPKIYMDFFDNLIDALAAHLKR